MRNLIPASERLGLSRAEAAEYVGFGVTLFDAMVADGRMPQPKRGNSRKVWSRLALEKAFAELPEDGPARQIQESADEWDALA
jgi:predicted DNA-binding transcriptional regulator AlpA